MINQCEYNQRPCVPNDFADHLDTTVGMCYSFNGKGGLIAQRAGEEYGY